MSVKITPKLSPPTIPCILPESGKSWESERVVCDGVNVVGSFIPDHFTRFEYVVPLSFVYPAKTKSLITATYLAFSETKSAKAVDVPSTKD